MALSLLSLCTSQRGQSTQDLSISYHHTHYRGPSQGDLALQETSIMSQIQWIRGLFASFSVVLRVNFKHEIYNRTKPCQKSYGNFLLQVILIWPAKVSLSQVLSLSQKLQIASFHSPIPICIAQVSLSVGYSGGNPYSEIFGLTHLAQLQQMYETSCQQCLISELHCYLGFFANRQKTVYQGCSDFLSKAEPFVVSESIGAVIREYYQRYFNGKNSSP
ncbi:hypothetical protein FGO68_gene2778 [Halteria grandinella]|uniref:Uncharacterized protein n=1 Tax=Halteria grandinella TaxID=5974 RepID=A0A8J8SZF3_HALGN|nr:hypothetical protein FGO68_gene2778 [Halteria grandinella]